MKLLYKYIGIKLIKNFFILIGFFSIIIVSSQLLHLPSILYHAGFFKFLQVLFFVNLSFFKYQLFFGFFVASLLVGYHIRESREIYAIYSASITKNDLLKPIIFLSVIFSLLALVVSLFVVPFANRERAKFITSNVRQHILDSLVENNFFKLSDRITIYVKKKKENLMEDLFIYNREKNIIITAKKALFKNNILFLENGYIQMPSQKGYNLLKFEKYRLSLDVRYSKKYEFEDMDNFSLISIIKEKNKDFYRAVGVITDRLSFFIPFLFVGVLGFLMGIHFEKNRDTLLGVLVGISIIYLVLNTYLIKLIQKGSIPFFVFPVVLFIYFGLLTYVFYTRK